jgi:hypothetical protein
MCADIGVPMAEDKTCGPDTTMTFLGVEIDSVRKEARLPKDKLDKCRQEIRVLLGCKKATLKQVQSVIGLLNFACQVVLPGRPFLRRLINATIGVKAPHHFVKLNKGIKRDLEVWLNFWILSMADVFWRIACCQVRHNGSFSLMLRQPWVMGRCSVTSGFRVFGLIGGSNKT